MLWSVYIDFAINGSKGGTYLARCNKEVTWLVAVPNALKSELLWSEFRQLMTDVGRAEEQEAQVLLCWRHWTLAPVQWITFMCWVITVSKTRGPFWEQCKLQTGTEIILICLRCIQGHLVKAAMLWKWQKESPGAQARCGPRRTRARVQVAFVWHYLLR